MLVFWSKEKQGLFDDIREIKADQSTTKVSMAEMRKDLQFGSKEFKGIKEVQAHHTEEIEAVKDVQNTHIDRHRSAGKITTWAISLGTFFCTVGGLAWAFWGD